MKITVLQKNLKQGIFVTSSITGKNNNLPILNNLLISSSNGSLKLSATDLELGVSTIVRGKIDEDGSVTVDAKLLSSYVALLPNNKIEHISLNCHTPPLADASHIGAAQHRVVNTAAPAPPM